MANPLPFKVQPVDPKKDLAKQLAAAPIDHGEALLVLWDLLDVSHREGILDAVVGLIGAKDEAIGKVADYAKLPEGVAGIRNLLSLLKIMASLDPESLTCLSDALDVANLEHRKETKPPSLWQLYKRIDSDDSRRGLSFLGLLLQAVGRSFKNGDPR